jgi:hypothetical protein
MMPMAILQRVSIGNENKAELLLDENGVDASDFEAAIDWSLQKSFMQLHFFL